MDKNNYSTQYKLYNKNRTLCLIVGFITMLFLGLIYAWSIFAEPLARSNGWSTEELSATFGILMAFFCLGCLASSYVSRRLNAHIALMLSALFMFLGFLLTSLFAAEGVVAVYVFYGMFLGLGCGFGYNAIVSTVNLWFPEKIGFSSGVLLLGYGFGALVLGSTIDAAMALIGWKQTFIVLAVIALVILSVAAGLIVKPPSDIGKVFVSWERKNLSPHIQKSYTPRQMLQTRILFFQLFWYIAVAVTGLVLIGESKQGALALGVEAPMATLLVGLVSTMNGVSRVVWGFLFDRFGLIKIMVGITFFGFFAALLIAVAYGTGHMFFYIVGALIMGFEYGGIPIVSSSFAMSRFGADYYATNYAIATSCMIPSSLISMFLAPCVRGFGGSVGLYSLLCLLTLGGMVMLYFFARQYRKDLRVKDNLP